MAAAATIVGALPWNDIYDDVKGKALCIEHVGSAVHLPEKKSGLSWGKAEEIMNNFVRENPKQHCADYTYWFMGGYTVRLYKAEGDIRVTEQSGDHNVIIDGASFAYNVKFG